MNFKWDKLELVAPLELHKGSNVLSLLSGPLTPLRKETSDISGNAGTDNNMKRMYDFFFFLMNLTADHAADINKFKRDFFFFFFKY